MKADGWGYLTSSCPGGKACRYSGHIGSTVFHYHMDAIDETTRQNHKRREWRERFYRVIVRDGHFFLRARG